MIDRLEVGFEPHHRALADEIAALGPEIEAIEAAADGLTEDELARRHVDLLAEKGILRLVVPCFDGDRPVYDARALCIAREGLARASGFSDVMFAMQGLGTAPLALGGAADARERLEDARTARAICAFALTEPEAGSDVASMATTARRDGDDYVLDGTKTFISNAGIADSYTVFAKTDADAGHAGISAFAVDAGTPGFEVVERQEVIAPHPIGTLRFDGCRVPAARRIGAEGDGFKLAMRTLDVFRVTVGAAANGLARRALAEAIDRAGARVQFGKPIGRFQAIQFHVAAMASELDAARLLVFRAASRMDASGQAAPLDSSMAKLAATESAQRIADRAVQIFGGQGVLKGNVVERLYREVRALRIYEGTTEIQHVVIGRKLLDGEPHGY